VPLLALRSLAALPLASLVIYGFAASLLEAESRHLLLELPELCFMFSQWFAVGLVSLKWALEALRLEVASHLIVNGWFPVRFHLLIVERVLQGLPLFGDNCHLLTPPSLDSEFLAFLGGRLRTVEHGRVSLIDDRDRWFDWGGAVSRGVNLFHWLVVDHMGLNLKRRVIHRLCLLPKKRVLLGVRHAGGREERITTCFAALTDNHKLVVEVKLLGPLGNIVFAPYYLVSPHFLNNFT
jgi:hypothetical protein